jgi:hypothetical protein
MTPQPNTEEGNEKAKDIVLDLINGIFGNVIGSSLIDRIKHIRI